jgi:hypothetical protein
MRDKTVMFQRFVLSNGLAYVIADLPDDLRVYPRPIQLPDPVEYVSDIFLHPGGLRFACTTLHHWHG